MDEAIDDAEQTESATTGTEVAGNPPPFEDRMDERLPA